MPKPEHHLRKRDPILGKVISRVTPPPLTKGYNYFRTLVQSIISQQLSEKAGATIERRFVSLFGRTFPKPEMVMKARVSFIRKAGVSNAKAEFIIKLAKAFARKEINFTKIKKLPDEEVILELVKLKGVGKWTAEMFLIFTLGRPDVFSYGDVGLRNAISRLYKVKGKRLESKIKQLEKIWTPHRSTACRYLWASLALKD